MEVAGDGARATSTASTSTGSGARIFNDERLFDSAQLPGRAVEEARRQAAQPRRARRVGRLGQRLRQEGVRPAAVHRCLGRPRRVDQHRRLRQGLRRHARLGLVRARQEPATARSCRSRSPSSPTPAWSSAWPRSTWPPTRSTTFNGFWGACSTYGSFSYLKYGPMRLFSQLAQDCELKLGKVLWVAGHSGPETAEDSRTHFGIFETGVTQLFPEGHVIDLHPWEYNEVPVVLAAALRDGRAHRGAAPDAAGDRDPRPRGAGHAVALRGGARRVRDARLPPGPAARRHGLRPGHDLHREPGQGPAASSTSAASTSRSWPCISPQLFALQDAAYREATASLRRPLGRHGDHQPRAGMTMRHWIGGPDRARVLAVVRLGRPLAHRRHGRRGHRRGAPWARRTSWPGSSASCTSARSAWRGCAR